METRQVIKAVVPVAGLGTRLLPATKAQPKEMLPVGRKPVVQYVVEEMQAAGVKQILFITGRKKTVIEDHFDTDPELVRILSSGGGYAMLEELAYTETDTRFYYTRQSVPNGLADAIGHTKEFVDNDPFLVALGDSIIRNHEDGSLAEKMIRAHLENGAACTIAVEEVNPDEVYRYGVVKPSDGADLAGSFAVSDLVEKPKPENAPSNLAIAARYVFSPVIFDAISRTLPDRNGEMQLTDSIRLLIQLGYPVQAIRLTGSERRYDIGNFESYFKAFMDFALSDEKYGYLVRQYLKRKVREF
ncbi:MAG: UTP--glucose-1-phosphate uridylyltransferase [Chloroflexi bacterium]|nr:UTP--glucose-1-phosphate uridylyltransferase [Chloroflexota bacterium]